MHAFGCLPTADDIQKATDLALAEIAANKDVPTNGRS
jgi:hypothetical protein